METKDADDTPRLCALCHEFEPAGGCVGGHHICAACVTAIVRTTEKLLGVTDIPPLCPLEGCTEFLRAPTVEKARAGSRRLARLVRLAPADPEYADVLAAFGAPLAGFAGGTLAAANVRNIYRVENPALRAVYEACRERMDKEGRRGPGANEKRVFHATTRAAAGSIVREGFDVHRAGKAHGTALGVGIYVANDAMFSHGYSSEDSVGARAMFVCQALLGAAGRNSKSSGGQHVVFREQQVLPTHLIHYDT